MEKTNLIKIDQSHLKKLRNQLKNNWYWLKSASYKEVYDHVLAALKCENPGQKLFYQNISMKEKIIDCKSEEDALNIIKEVHDKVFTDGWKLSYKENKHYFGNIKYNNYLNYIRE